MQILITATIAFLDASRFDRYPEDMEIARSGTRGVPVPAASGNNAAFIFPQGHVSLLSLQTSAQGDVPANLEVIIQSGNSFEEICSAVEYRHRENRCRIFPLQGIQQ